MAKKEDISNEEKALFRNSVAGTRPLKTEARVEPEKKRPPARPLQKENDDQPIIQDIFADPYDLIDMEIEEELFFARNGLQKRTLKKLKRGEIAIEAELDLHRRTKLEARQAITNFLYYCHTNKLHCVRIIHGKGYGSHGKQPILKQFINYWLRQREDILAFCSARQVDGGTGAVYVLLKTKYSEE